MYLHLGGAVVVRKKDILAVFDLDNTTQSSITKKYLANAEKNGRIINVSGDDLPKSYVVCSDNGEQTIYICQLNSSTLQKRSENQKLTDFDK